MSYYTVVSTKVQAPVFMLDLSGELVNESRTGKRDASGKFLKQHVSMNAATFSHSAQDEAMAADFGCEAEDIFIGKRH